MQLNIKVPPAQACPQCLKELSRCFCGKTSAPLISKEVLVLQHPQEKYKSLNSAMLVKTLLSNCTLKTGLCWRNFSHALGHETNPATWAVLYLGPARAETTAPALLYNRKRQQIDIAQTPMAGIIAIDGSWKQAKTLWWRNAWLLKCNRLELNLRHQSLRPQAKEQGLSTIEALSYAFDFLGEDPATGTSLRDHYARLIIT